MFTFLERLIARKHLVRRFLLLILASVAMEACRPAFSTPLEALTEAPGFLISPEYYDPESVKTAHEQAVPDGEILIYYWRVKEESMCHVSITFVSKGLFGWQAQSSGDMQSECELSQMLNWETSALIGGNTRNLTAIYGVSPKGVSVRVEWPDGFSAITPITDGVFVQARSEQFTSWRLELLDVGGAVMESQDIDITR